MTDDPKAKLPAWKKSQQAWETIRDQRLKGGKEDLDARRAALVGIFSFLGMDVDEKKVKGVEAATSDEVTDAMHKIERFLQ
jgi:hypothetical protein